MPFTYEYPRPAVTVDVSIFTIRGGELAVLLIKRGKAPFRGAWALPGGFVDESESLERAAARELYEETGLSGVRLVQVGAFGDPGRDPRGHTVSVAFLAFAVAAGRPLGKVKAGDDAAAAEWHPVASLGIDRAPTRGSPKLAFDHARVLATALARLRDEVARGVPSASLEFVPQRFTMSELQHVHEAVLGRAVDKRNFRAKLLASKTVTAAEAERRTGRHRPAQLFRWTSEAKAEMPAPKAHARAPRKPAKKGRSR